MESQPVIMVTPREGSLGTIEAYPATQRELLDFRKEMEEKYWMLRKEFQETRKAWEAAQQEREKWERRFLWLIGITVSLGVAFGAAVGHIL